jgi:hypothetical protein
VLPDTITRIHHVIDYLCTAVLALAATSLVLLTTLGGNTYAWESAPIIILAVAGVALIGVFVAVERRAKEPELPLRLFTNQVFSAASAIGFAVGFAMFGPGFSGPLQLVGHLANPADETAFADITRTLAREPGVASVSLPVVSPAGTVALADLYPDTSPQSTQTTALLKRLRNVTVPAAARSAPPASAATLTGANVYLTKPFGPTDLLSACRTSVTASPWRR